MATTFMPAAKGIARTSLGPIMTTNNALNDNMSCDISEHKNFRNIQLIIVEIALRY
jgi:hypothetical protein